MNIGTMRKDGVVGDLGSRPENVTSYTMEFHLRSKDDVRLLKETITKEILSEELTETGNGWKYVIRVKSLNGIG